MFQPLRPALAAACIAAAGAAGAQPAPLKGLALVDHRAEALSPALLRARPALVHFVFTTCSTACPLQVHELAQVHRALPADVRERVRFLSVTVDPLQDTPASLAAFARRLDADRPGWHFATGPGTHALIERLQALEAGRPVAEHRTSLFLFDARGQLAQRYAGQPVDRARLVDEITQVARLR